MSRVMCHWVFAASCAYCLGCSSQEAPLTEGELALQESGMHLQGSGACPALAQIDLDCPADLAWDNHGQYVSCVAKYTAARVTAGDLSEEQRQSLIVLAAQSSIGKPPHGHLHSTGYGHGDMGAADDGGGLDHDSGAAGCAGSTDADEHEDDAEGGSGGATDRQGVAGARADDDDDGELDDDGDDGDQEDDDAPDWGDAAGEKCP